MNIIINIGLGQPRHDENHMGYTRRLKNAFAWIGENFDRCYLEHRFGIGIEPTLVVEGLLRESHRNEVHERLHELALSVNQDCVAAIHGEKEMLVGPYAHKWCPFDKSKFLFPTRRSLI